MSGESDAYSAETVEAVKAFQTSEKLPVTGKVDADTASALEMKLATKLYSKDLTYEKALEEVKKSK